MFNIQHLRDEINTLEQIKNAYIHFLCSYEAQYDVENTTQVEVNKVTVKQSLSKLYQELNKAEAKNKAAKSANPMRRTYRYSDAETEAILHFNTDKRFTITE